MPGADVAQEKAAEGTAALHVAGARFARPLHIGEAFGAPVFSGAFGSMQFVRANHDRDKASVKET